MRKEAERAALAQKVQLRELTRALQSMETSVAGLEREAAAHSRDLARLEEEIERLRARLRAEAGATRAGDRDRADAPAGEPSASSDREARERRRGAAVPSGGFAGPDVGEDWEEYVRNVDRYIADHGIEVVNPLEQLVPPQVAADIRRRFHREFGPAPWDGWDYAAVALAVVVGGLTDYLLVATPGGSFKGEPQRGSPLTAWMKEQSKKLAPMTGADDVERNSFQRLIAKLTTAAEGWTKVPYDLVDPKVGLTPNLHRLASLGHDPLLGLLFGVGDILSGRCTFIDRAGSWRVIDAPGQGSSNVLEAIVKQVVHGFSDVFTERGLPPPFLGPLQLVGATSGFTLKEGGEPVPVRELVRHMYRNGYDLRHFVTMKISPAIAEVILRTYHAVRDFGSGAEPVKAGFSPEKLKREQMLALTHALLASANVLKVALYGWNPMAINLAQFQALAKRMLSLVKLAVERDRLIQRRLDEGLRDLLADPPACGREGGAAPA